MVPLVRFLDLPPGIRSALGVMMRWLGLVFLARALPPSLPPPRLPHFPQFCVRCSALFQWRGHFLKLNFSGSFKFAFRPKTCLLRDASATLYFFAKKKKPSWIGIDAAARGQSLARERDCRRRFASSRSNNFVAV